MHWKSLHGRRVDRLLACALLVVAPTLRAQQPAAVRLALIESLSGSFANTGEAVYRNLVRAVERVNAGGGVKLADGMHPLQLDRYDSKGQTDEALSTLRSAIDDGTHFVLQGNSSATAAALIAAIGKNNEREPARSVLFLNYAAVDPALTNERCSFWHFRIASGAQAVITGNWGNDLTLLVKAAHDAGYTGRFYTFYGNALGAPAAIREAGIGQVVAVADWLPNVPTVASADFYRSFRARFPMPADDYVHLRMQLMIEALAQALERAGSSDPVAVARALESADVTLAGQRGRMRARDHQFQQPLVVG